MIDTQRMLDVVSGRRKDMRARLLRFVFGGASLIYGFFVRRRNVAFDLRADKTRRVDVPVVSIGNITTGGTGKTPMTIWLANHLAGLGIKPAIISRGFGAKDGNKNDEAMEIESRLPGVVSLQNPERFQIAVQAINDHAAQALILDDGFQHRQLGRNLDIVLIDATCPFGYGQLLPRGLLREPIASLRRADIAVVTRVDLVTPKEVQEIVNRIRDANENLLIAKTKTVPTEWMLLPQPKTPAKEHQSKPLGELNGKSVLAFCAIGNPDSFFSSIEKLGCALQHRKTFADHHHFTKTEFDDLLRLAIEKGCTHLVCTHKDLVKLESYESSLPVFALTIGIEFVEGQEEVEKMIEATMRQAR